MKWPHDLQDDFRDTRKNEVTSTIRAACQVLGTTACFRHIAGILEQQLGPEGYAKTGNWRLLEGAIFCMRALARCIDSHPGVDPVIVSLLKVLPHLPAHKEIHYTSLLIVGRYADWLKTDPVLLAQLFSYVVASLQHPDTAPSAALSFKNICEACAKMIAEKHLMEILQLTTFAVQSTTLQLNEHVEIIDGVAQVISALAFEESVKSIQVICQPILALIQQHATTNSNATTLADNLCKLATLLVCITTFRSNPDKKTNIAETLWPILEPVFRTHPTDQYVIDQLFRCIRYSLDNFPSSFLPPPSSLLPSLIQNMKNTFRLSQNPCIIYTATALLKYYSKNPEYTAILWDLLLDLSQTTLSPPSHNNTKGNHTQPSEVRVNAELASEYGLLLEYAVMDYAAQMRSTMGLVDSIVRWSGKELVLLAQLSRQDSHQREAFYNLNKMLSTFLAYGIIFLLLLDLRC